MAEAKIELTIRATNGTPWQTSEFGLHQKVNHVRKKAIDHFVSEHAMTEGDYSLALIQDNVATPLIDSETLKQAMVSECAVLALMVRGPQVDG